MFVLPENPFNVGRWLAVAGSYACYKTTGEGLAMREIHPFVNLYEKGRTGEHSSPVLRNQYLSNVLHGQSDAFSGNVKRFDLYLDAIAYGKHFGGVLDEFF